MVDSYGVFAPHGGGAFSGKDPTKVDRSASYAARYAAKNIVAAGLAEECELQLAYAIGVAHPVSVRIDTRGTAKAKETDIENALCQVMDFRPQAIIERLGLRRPLYRQIAAYGHFGRPDLDLPWEKLDLMEDLKKKGMWFVCADMGGELMYRLNLKGPIGLVVGNEGEGVGKLVKEHCDMVASIPMKGDIDSLNASVAAGVLAYEIVRQRLS